MRSVSEPVDIRDVRCLLRSVLGVGDRLESWRPRCYLPPFRLRQASPYRTNDCSPPASTFRSQASRGIGTVLRTGSVPTNMRCNSQNAGEKYSAATLAFTAPGTHPSRGVMKHTASSLQSKQRREFPRATRGSLLPCRLCSLETWSTYLVGRPLGAPDILAQQTESRGGSEANCCRWRTFYFKRNAFLPG